VQELQRSSKARQIRVFDRCAHVQKSSVVPGLEYRNGRAARPRPSKQHHPRRTSSLANAARRCPSQAIKGWRLVLVKLPAFRSSFTTTCRGWLWFQAGGRWARHPRHSGVPWASINPTHGALHRTGAGSVQEFLEGLARGLIDTHQSKRSRQRPVSVRFREQSGRQMLTASLTGFDPHRTSAVCRKAKSRI
jgi:hypothetical protein